MSRVILWVILVYQKLVSPFLGPNCRFEPSCSHYGYEAIKRHGVLKGLSLTTRRLLKCQPFHSGGTDPVP